MNLRSRRLPLEYQEVEWIASDGNQWLQTDVLTPEYGIKLKSKFMAYSYGSGYSSMFGIANSSVGGLSASTCIFKSKGTSFMYYMGSGYAISSSAHITPLNSVCDLDYYCVCNGSNLVLKALLSIDDGVPYYASDFSTVDTHYNYINQSFSIFLSKHYNSINAPFIGRIYSLIVKNPSEETILNVVPCYRKSDGVIGMYNLANGSFYDNQGTGTFTKGADVVTVDAITINGNGVKQITDSQGRVLWKRISTLILLSTTAKSGKTTY